MAGPHSEWKEDSTQSSKGPAGGTSEAAKSVVTLQDPKVTKLGEVNKLNRHLAEDGKCDRSIVCIPDKSVEEAVLRM
jgi:hypothetical protein